MIVPEFASNITSIKRVSESVPAELVATTFKVVETVKLLIVNVTIPVFVETIEGPPKYSRLYVVRDDWVSETVRVKTWFGQIIWLEAVRVTLGATT